MRFDIRNTASIAKNLSIKQRKHAGVKRTVAVLKFANLFIDRESSDEMLGLPIGAIAQLYGEDGIPVSVITIGRKHIVFNFAGAIKGNANRQEQRALGKDTAWRCRVSGQVRVGSAVRERHQRAVRRAWRRHVHHR